MPAKEPAKPGSLQITLTPLLTEGRDALDARQAHAVKAVILRKLQFALNDRNHETLTREADDLFAPSENDLGPDLFPPDAAPVAATLAFHFADSPATETADLRPMGPVKIDPGTHSQTILSWLSESCLNALRTLSRPPPPDETTSPPIH